MPMPDAPHLVLGPLARAAAGLPALVGFAALLGGASSGCSESSLLRPREGGVAGRDGASARAEGGPGRSDGGAPGADGAVVPASCEGSLRVPLRVGEYAQAARRGSPVSGGIPFARGQLPESEVARLGLADDQGRRVASLQAPVPLGRWNDGSVKWLLLDFLADLPAGASRPYTLCPLPEPAPPAPSIRVEEAAGSFTVDTGRLKAVLSRQAFSLIQEAWVDANGDGAYATDERVVGGPGEMFIDLDDVAPGAPDAGAFDYPAAWSFGMEGGNWLRDSAASSAKRYLASRGDYAITIFRRGTTHTVFRLEGWHRHPASGRQFGRYTLYLHFYAGASFVRASHTWIMTGDPDKNFVRRMAFDLPLAPAQGTLDYAFGGPFERSGTPVRFDSSEPPFVPVTPGPSEVLRGTVAAEGEVALVSIGPAKYYHNVPIDRDLRVDYRLLEGGAEVARGYGASGWASVSNGRLGMAVGVQDFWREHPKEVMYRQGRLAAYLWPDHGGKALDLRRRYPEVRGPQDSAGSHARREFAPAGSAVGLAKTTDLFLYFFAGDHAEAEVDDVFRGFERPLRPIASAEWNSASGVLGNVRAHDASAFPRTENYLDLSFAWPLRSAEEFAWHGWLDYGDHLLEYESIDWELNVPPNPGLYQNWGYSGWTHEAYRLGQWMMMQYLRSGRDPYWRAADAWLRHHRDVDCVFWDQPDDGVRPGDNNGGPRAGGGHRHDQQHWGGYMASYGIPDIATTHHYFLTGEGRDLDALRAYAQWILHDARIENQATYAVLYMAEALGDPSLAQTAWSRNVTPDIGFGRWLYSSGMGLLLYDIQRGGEPAVRARLRAWAEHSDDKAVAFLRAYLESQERTGKYSAQIRRDFEALFPRAAVRAQFFAWAPRRPADFRDAFSPDLMPAGPWAWPLRSIEHLIFDAPDGLGNNPSRQMFTAQLPWLMDAYGRDP